MGSREHIRESETHVRYARMLRADVDDDKGTIEVIASTDAPVDMGGFREILVHDADAVDHSSAKTVLFNHDRNQPIGGVQDITIADGQLRASLDISREARAQTGVSIIELVRSGAIEGISIGYRFDDEDVEIDRDARTATVRKWMLREISLTPTQADVSAKITARARAMAEHFNNRGHPPKEEDMQFDAWLKARGLDPDKLTDKQRDALTKDFEAEQAREAEAKKRDNTDTRQAPDEAERAAEIAKERERAERAEIRAEVVTLAQRHGVDLSDITDLEEHCKRFAEKGEVARWLLERKADQEAKRSQHRGGAPIQIDYDQHDKARDAAEGMIFQRTGFKSEHIEQNPLVGRSYLDAGERWGEMLGIRGIRDWSRNDLAHFILGNFRSMSDMAKRDAANVINSTFSSFVTLDAITKIVAVGFEQTPRSVTYEIWTERNIVPDFKNFRVGALGTGNLQETAENAAFPELAKSEGVYSEAVKMWGGTLSLSLQALINDDTSQFDRSLRMAGPIARKTIDKRTYQKLLRGTTEGSDTSTWTSNTTTGDIQYATADAAMAARQNLDTVIAGMMTKTGQDGNPLGNVPSFLLCAPALAGQARGITGGQAPGQTTTQAPTAGDIQVVPSAWLQTGSGLTGADSAHYYLASDPREVTTMLISMIRGMESPQVMEYDAGAVAARHWKIFQPFEASLPGLNNSAGTEIFAGVHQGTD